MSQQPFRFVHASDLHLERPPHGLAEVPNHLRELFIEAPYLAAERVFRTALDAQVDFVVLSGDVWQAELAGPRAGLFLVEQFERLRARQIAVYWAGGQLDPPDAWPAALRLPENVHRFSQTGPEVSVHERGGAPVARLAGLGQRRSRPIRPADFWPDPGGLFSIAVVHGSADRALLAHPIHYWALGGRHARGTLLDAGRVAHYPGTPQGREPAEPGPHGCTVVYVDVEGRARSKPAPTDVLRWHSEQVRVDAATTRDDLERSLGDRMRRLAAGAPGLALCVSWTIAGSGPVMALLGRGTLAADLLAGLRSQYGHATPAAWSVSLAAEAKPAVPLSWYEEQTMLGEFLRRVRELRSPGPGRQIAIDLQVYLKGVPAAAALARAAGLDDPQTRERVLEKAAILGAELLSGEGRPA